MSPADQPSHEHQVGITNAQVQNPDAEIRRLTAEMNALFAAQQYTEAARIALSITALSKDELRETFERHGVMILHLDHEAFGIYRVIEPSYDLRVDGGTSAVLAAATEFGKRHAQEAVLIAQAPRRGNRSCRTPGPHDRPEHNHDNRGSRRNCGNSAGLWIPGSDVRPEARRRSGHLPHRRFGNDE